MNNHSHQKHIVVVLGMHRSGTSAITRGLQVMGVELGGKLMPPEENNNDKGFWEDIDLTGLNAEMLSAINSDWDYLSAIRPTDIDILYERGYLLRAAELLRQKVGGAPVFGFKDPRIAKLLPFWKGVFSSCKFDVSYVLAVRHPLSVVKSLAIRNGLDIEKSYLLWLAHVIPSLSNTAKDVRVLVDYDRLMQSPGREMQRVAKCAGLEIDPMKLQHYKMEFLDPELRHTFHDMNDLLADESCPPIVREIYVDLLEVASDKSEFDNLELQKKVVYWSRELERLRSPLLLVDRLSTQKAEQDAKIALLVAGRDAKIAELRHFEAELAMLRATKVMRLRDAVMTDPWGFRKVARIGYLLILLVTPRPVKNMLLSFARKPIIGCMNKFKGERLAIRRSEEADAKRHFDERGNSESGDSGSTIQ